MGMPWDMDMLGKAGGGKAVDDWREARKSLGHVGAGRIAGKQRCAHCGARFPESDDDCPKCGAGA